jgi:hypothetical protein
LKDHKPVTAETTPIRIDRMSGESRTWSKHGFEDGNNHYFRELNTDLSFTVYHPVVGCSAAVKVKVKQSLYRPVSGLDDSRSLRLPDFETFCL